MPSPQSLSGEEMAACDGASEFLLSATSPAPSFFNKGFYVKTAQGNAKVGLLFLCLLCSVPVWVCMVTTFGFMIANCWGILGFFLTFGFHSVYKMKEGL